jgi:hypothetical protein
VPDCAFELAGVRDISESTTVKMSTWMETTLGSGREVWMMMIDIQGTEGKVIRGAVCTRHFSFAKSWCV